MFRAAAIVTASAIAGVTATRLGVFGENTINCQSTECNNYYMGSHQDCFVCDVVVLNSAGIVGDIPVLTESRNYYFRPAKVTMNNIKLTNQSTFDMKIISEMVDEVIKSVVVKSQQE